MRKRRGERGLFQSSYCSCRKELVRRWKRLAGICSVQTTQPITIAWLLNGILKALQEELKLTKEDRVQRTKNVPDRYGFDVKPEMVNEDIHCDGMRLDSEYNGKKNYKPLHLAADNLKDVSAINSEVWDLMKLTMALKIIIICYPVETTIDDKEVNNYRWHNHWPIQSKKQPSVCGWLEHIHQLRERNQLPLPPATEWLAHASALMGRKLFAGALFAF